jgi:NAD(P)H-flavin reductase
MSNKESRKQKELYLPIEVKIIDIADLTSDVKLFRLEKPKGFFYSPGQFVMASVWGAGDVPISITSTYEIHKDIELCIRKVGQVTSALHALRPDDHIGIRGPFGNRFPFEEAMGKDVLFVAGGIGIAPLRSLVNLVVKQKSKFGRIALIYGSRNPSEALFLEEIELWKGQGIDVTLTVDVTAKGWKHNTGFVTEFINKQKIDFKSSYAFICGPHPMIKAVMRDLSFLGMSQEKIITTLEAHMKCGVGKCGHCYTDGKYVCTDGPVFSFEEIRKIGMSNP